MKTLKLLFAAAVLSLTTIACSSDDNKNNETTNSLVGKWTYEKEEALDANGNVVSTYIPDIYEFCEKDVYEFENNGTYLITQYEYDSEKCNISIHDNYTWKLEGNVLTVITNYRTSTHTITFSGNTAILEAPLSREEYENGDYELNVVKLRTYLNKVK